MKILRKKQYDALLIQCKDASLLMQALQFHITSQIKYIMWSDQMLRHIIRTIVWNELGVWIYVYDRISPYMRRAAKKSRLRKPLRKWNHNQSKE